MIALTYMSKAQYRDIRKSCETMTLKEMYETYGICFPLKIQQYLIVDILESAWQAYKSANKNHAPKNSDDFYSWIVEEKHNVNGKGTTTIWQYGLDITNKKMTEYNERHGKTIIPELKDNELTRATLYTHIKAKIGDWEE